MPTLPNVPITPHIERRFWALVRKGDGDNACWEWIGHCWKDNGEDAYGVLKIKVDGTWRRYKAHRVAYAIHYGKWPDHFACHACDNPRCVRGDHLFDGTSADNSADMAAKGRGACGDRSGAHKHPETVLRGENHGNHILTEEDIRAILATDVSERGARAELARRYGVSKTMISAIVLGKSWRHITGDGAPKRFGLSEEQIAEIKARYRFDARRGDTASKLAREFGVAGSTIRRIGCQEAGMTRRQVAEMRSAVTSRTPHLPAASDEAPPP